MQGGSAVSVLDPDSLLVCVTQHVTASVSLSVSTAVAITVFSQGCEVGIVHGRSSP